MKMKNRSIILMIVLMCFGTFARAEGESKADTIEVNFGDKGKILIHVESKEDLEALKKYDLNSMLEDINVPVKDELASGKLPSSRKLFIPKSIPETNVVLLPENLFLSRSY